MNEPSMMWCGNEDESSVFIDVTKLCRHLLTREIEVVDERENQAQIRKCRTIAYSLLLAPSVPTLPVLDGSDPESLSLEIFSTIAAKKITEDKWNELGFNHAFNLALTFELLAKSRNLEYIEGIVRFFIALAHCEQTITSPPPPTEKNFFLPSYHSLRIVPHDVEERISNIPVLWSSFKQQLELLRLPPRKESISPSLALERPVESHLSVSRSNWDEGFFSPSAPSADSSVNVPIDWNDIDLTPFDPPLDMDSLAESPSFRHHITESHRRLRMNIQRSPSCLVKVSKETLQLSLRALLHGIPSTIFPMVNGSFTMIPGLFTDCLPPLSMRYYIKQWLLLGNLYHRFSNLTEINAAPARTTLQNSLAELKLEYSQAVISHCLSLQFSKSMSFLQNRLSYAVGVLETGLSGWRLVEKLCLDIHTCVNMGTFYAVLPLFFDCCVQFVSILDKWVFEGVWPLDLFSPLTENDIQFKNLAPCIPSNLTNVPTFIPAKELWVCGMLVRLMGITSKNNGRPYLEQMEKPCRPSISLVFDQVSFEKLKIQCDAYSHLGEDLRAEIFASDNENKLAFIAAKKAAIDSINFQKLSDAEREKKILEKMNRVAQMREEIRKYEEHKQIYELENKLHSIISDEQILFDQLKRGFDTCESRVDVILKFVHQEEIYARRLMVNSWKRKRYLLRMKREAYFANERGASTLSSNPSKATFSSSVQTEQNNETLPVIVTQTADRAVITSTSTNTLSSPCTMDVCRIMASPTVSPPRTSSTPVLKLQSSSILPLEVFQSDLDCTSNSTHLTSTSHPEIETTDGMISNHSPETLDWLSPLSANTTSNLPETTINNIAMQRTGVEGSVYNKLASDFAREAPESILQPFKSVIEYFERRTKAGRSSCDSSSDVIVDLLRDEPLFFMRKLIQLPLEAQTKVVNNVLMYQIFMDHDFLGHVDRIKQTFFLNDGVFGSSLAENLMIHFEDGEACNYHHFSQLQKILKTARPSDSEYLSLVVNEDDEPYKNHPAVLQILPMVALEYKLSAPLDAVFTSEVFMQSNVIFSHLLGIERIRALHKRAFVALKELPSSNNDHHQISLHRHAMNLFLTHLKSYCGWAVEDCHQCFLRSIKHKNVDSLYRHYSKLVLDLHIRLMLTKKHFDLREQLKYVLRCIMSYFKTLVYGQWSVSLSNTLSFQKINKLLRTYEKFESSSLNFQKLLQIYSERRGHDYLRLLQQKLSIG